MYLGVIAHAFPSVCLSNTQERLKQQRLLWVLHNKGVTSARKNGKDCKPESESRLWLIFNGASGRLRACK